MTDNEIIKAVEHCHRLVCGCVGCPFDGETDCLCKSGEAILDLINRQKAEIESLKIAIEVTRDNLGDARVELQNAESEIERLKGMVSQNEGVLPQYEAIVRAEEIKEFAERLKERKVYSTERHENIVPVAEIDWAVKEMTEERNGRIQ